MSPSWRDIHLNAAIDYADVALTHARSQRPGWRKWQSLAIDAFLKAADYWLRNVNATGMAIPMVRESA